jgi:uncharacterized protein (TIGR03435 family)
MNKLLATLLLALTLPLARAQTPTPTESKAPSYDVVTIKPNNSGKNGYGTNVNRDSFSADNISIRNLLQSAYGIKEDLISGVPGPLDSLHFDIQAKIVDYDASGDTKLTQQQRQQMLLPVLTGRFHLKAHTEIKTLPVYELVVIPGGPRFKQSPPSDEKRGSGTTIRNHELSAHDRTMAAFASTLTDQVKRTVIDKTGLAGNYDFSLKWSAEDSPADTTDAPSIFTALPEQLGLKLQPAKGPVETLVVDHVETPSDN